MTDQVFDLYDREKLLLAEGQQILDAGDPVQIQQFAVRLFDRFGKLVRENEDSRVILTGKNSAWSNLIATSNCKRKKSSSKGKALKRCLFNSPSIFRPKYIRRCLRVNTIRKLQLRGKS